VLNQTTFIAASLASGAVSIDTSRSGVAGRAAGSAAQADDGGSGLSSSSVGLLVVGLICFAGIVGATIACYTNCCWKVKAPSSAVEICRDHEPDKPGFDALKIDASDLPAVSPSGLQSEGN